MGQFSHSPLLSFSKVCWLSILPSCHLWPSELSSLCSLQPAEQTQRARVPERLQHWSLLVNGAINTPRGFAVWWCLVWAQRSPLHTWLTEGLVHRNSWVWPAGFGRLSFGLWTDFQGSSTSSPGIQSVLHFCVWKPGLLNKEGRAFLIISETLWFSLNSSSKWLG